MSVRKNSSLTSGSANAPNWSRFRVSFPNISESKDAEQVSKEWIEKVLQQPLVAPNGYRLALLDGVVLCKLCNTLWPGSIPKFVAKCNNHFQSLDNLQKVIAAFQEHGLHSRDLFRASDLKQDSTFGRVVDCLLCLAQMIKKQKETGQGPQISPALRAPQNTSRGDSIFLSSPPILPASTTQNTPEETKRPDIPTKKRNRRSVFAATPDLSQQNEPLPMHAKDERARNLLDTALRANFLFSSVQNDEQVQQIVESMYPIEVPQGETIIRQGDEGNHFYVVDSGDFEIWVRKEGEEEAKLVSQPGQFGPGSSFGELALMYNCPRASTVKAAVPSKVWALERQVFRRIVVSLQSSKMHQKIEFVMQVPDFRSLSPYEHSHVALAMDERTYAEGENIIRQGDIGMHFFILFRGKAVVTLDGDDDIKVTYNPGDYFGERALLSNEPRAANVTAIDGPVTCLCLSRQDFIALLGPLRDVMKRKATVESGRDIRWVQDLAKRLQDQEGGEDGLASSQSARRSDIKMDDLDHLSLIGCGSFGTVELVKHQATGTTYALKTVSKAHIVRTGQTKHVLSEKNVMMQADHPFLVNLVTTFQDKDCLYFLTELCLGGELMFQLKRLEKFDENTARFYAASVLLAIDHLHSRNIIYRDLKPENLLLDTQGYLKMTDFGFTKILKDGEVTYTLCGTPDYLAPEVLDNSGHSKAADWWSFGILIFEMLAGYPPFYNENPWTTYKNIKKGVITYPEHFSEDAVDLISKLLEPKQTLRLGVIKGGVGMIKQHPWFRTLDFDQLLSRNISPPIPVSVSHAEDLSYFDEFDPSIIAEMDLFPEYNDPDSTWAQSF